MLSSQQALALLPLVLVAPHLAAADVTYAQTNLYEDGCFGQPIFVRSVLVADGATCPAATCTALDPKNTRYVKSQTNCQANYFQGKIANYVAISQYASAADNCNTPPTSVLAIAADALCHPNENDKTSWVSVNCNGGLPIYKTCQESTCTNCSSIQNMKVGCAGTTYVQCANYLKPNGGSTGSSTFDPNADSSASRLPVTLGLISAASLCFLSLFL